MAVALVGSRAASSVALTASPFVTAFGQTPTAGNLLILTVTNYNTTQPSFTTPTGWTRADTDTPNNTQSGSGFFQDTAVFYRVATGSDTAPSVVVTGAHRGAWMVEEWSGLAAASPLDAVSTPAVDGNTAGTSVPLTMNAVTTSNATDWLYSVFGFYKGTAAASTVTGTWGGGFTKETDPLQATTSYSQVGAATETVSSAGSYTPTLTVTNSSSTVLLLTAVTLAFLQAGGGSPAASGTAALTFTAGGNGAAPATGAAALTFTAVAGAGAAAAGTAALTFTATAAASGVSGAAALTFTAAGATRAPAAGTAVVTFTASGAVKAAAAGTAALVLTALAGGGLAASGTAALTFTAAGPARAAAAGNAALTFTAALTAAAAATAAAALTFTATATSAARASGSAQVTLQAAVTARAAILAAAVLTFTATGTAVASVTRRDLAVLSVTTTPDPITTTTVADEWVTQLTPSG